MKTRCSIIIPYFAVCVVFFLLVFFSLARDVSITILHTADIHGNITDVKSKEEAGGILRCSTLIRGIRKQEPNVLLIDCGDLIQGTAVSFLTKGEIMIRAVKALKYDALITGNHEFDWGIENLRRLYSHMDIPVLDANMSSSKPDRQVFPNARPFLIREMDGVRVAVVGLNTPHVPRWAMPLLLGDLKFEKSVAALRRIMPYVREKKPDVLVLAVHQGHRKWGDDSANEINAIVRSFPEFDVILGGHTHEAVVRRELDGVTYTQAGCYGLWLGKVSLIVDAERHCVKRKKVELIRVDDSIKPDRDLENRFAKSLSRAESYLNQTVGRADCDHLPESRFPGQSQVQMLIARAIAEAVGADVVFHGALSGATLYRGRITMRDVWWIVPFENYIGIAHLTLSELRTILDENSSRLNSRHFRGVYGVTYELNPDASSGLRVRNVRLTDGRRLGAHKRIKVAINSYDMASAGNRFPRLREIIEQPLSKLKETEVDTRSAVVEYIKKHSPINERAKAGAVLVKDRP